ncbi:MAG: endonuclease/exonuclease/phosphatase family protein [Anaerolineae bacterium]
MSNVPQRRRSLTSLVIGLTTFYSALLSIILMARRPLRERREWLGIFNSFAHVLMLPALALLPLSILLRHRPLGLTALIPAFTFINAYGRRMTRNSSAAVGKADVTIMTYNLHGEAHHLEPMLRLIEAANADVVALQELSDEAAGCFETALRERYPFQALYPQSPSNNGQGVLSRFPITNHDYWRNPHISPNSLGHERVGLDVNGNSMTLYNAHPLHPGMGSTWFDTAARARELDTVLEKAVKETGAVLIVGDFNMSDQSDEYERMRSRYSDAFDAVGRGMGFTFPDLRTFESLPSYWPLPLALPPFLRLDYIFHTAHFIPLEACVWPESGGSDHRPVIARLALQAVQ